MAKSEKIKRLINIINRPVSSRKLTIIFILLAIFVATLIITYKKNTISIESKRYIAPIEKDAVFVFYPVNQEKLGKKALEIKPRISEQEKADIIIKELKKEKCVPDNLKLYELATDGDGIIYLNFSRDILNAKARTAKEITMTYAIINSFLSSFKDIKKVQFLVEGQPVYTINGLIYTYVPIEFNKDLMED
jgi:hypothetical protein